MEKEFTPGKMEENMKVSINLIKNMDSVLILGKTAEDMSANGKIVNVTVEEKSSQLTELKSKAYGKMT